MGTLNFSFISDGHKFRESFRKMDSNHNSEVTKTEILSYLRRNNWFNIAEEHRLQKEYMAKWDRDRNGILKLC